MLGELLLSLEIDETGYTSYCSILTVSITIYFLLEFNVSLWPKEEQLGEKALYLGFYEWNDELGECSLELGVFDRFSE